MSDVIMTEEAEAMDDVKPFSGLALVAFLLSLVGGFALQYIPLLFVAGIAVGLALFAKSSLSKGDFSTTSHVLANFALLIGLTSMVGGILARNFSTQGDLVHAKNIAETYLNSIHKGDFGTLALLNEMEIPNEAFEKRTPTEEERYQFKKKSMLSEPVLQEIQRRKDPPNWKFVKLESEIPTPFSCIYKLTYQDEALSMPPKYTITVKRDSPKGGPWADASKKGMELREKDFKVRWVVTNLVQAK